MFWWDVITPMLLQLGMELIGFPNYLAILSHSIKKPLKYLLSICSITVVLISDKNIQADHRYS